ncbi:CPBP family intramembrane metalloprotease [Alteromonadaceae bacterium M269]|nr:CPBP family intramembrane metalloprotease [Alteromonadaceae bacterium M269]
MGFFEQYTPVVANELNGVDILLLAVIVIGWPIYSYLNLKKYPIESVQDDPNIRLSSYNKTMIELWSLAIAIILLWFWVNRPFEALGFQHELNTETVITWVITALGISFNALLLYQVHVNKEAKEKVAAQLNKVGEMTKLLMPKTNQEYRRSMLVAVTAGITEEIIFRGYLIWTLSLYVPTLVAGLLSVAVFIFLHRYQDKAGLVQVSIFAVVTTIMVLVSQSLWPVIILHIGIDVLSISLARKVHEDS